MTGEAAFNPTRWSLISAVRSGSEPRVAAALETLCATYWYPLYAYIRRSGHGAEEARDLTQGLFLQVLEKDFFAQADQHRGRLRTFLLTATQRFVRDHWQKQQRQKRGGGVAVLSIDEAVAEGLYAREPLDGRDAEAIYHRRWALTLLDQSMDRLREDYTAQGKSALFEALKSYLAVDDEEVSAAEAGRVLGLEPGAVRVAIFRLRRRYREKLLQEVAASIDAQTEAEVDAEIADLFRALT
jgi:DNA-directed RNA polymerase specialized sigma24 family protein